MQASSEREGTKRRPNHEQTGPGGYKCTCCGPSPKRRKSARRTERRRTKQSQKGEG